MLEDTKSSIFFKVFNVINELEVPPLIKVSTLILPIELDIELSKLKDKCIGEFNDLSYFSKDKMCAWTIDYIILNNNVSNNFEAHENLLQVEREIF